MIDGTGGLLLVEEELERQARLLDQVGQGSASGRAGRRTMHAGSGGSRQPT
ncbi:MAG: hypothetical protein KY451_06290 [Actinobacteria bacterium]|nr:hypothetical protein [Actinomycetota bacterium]